MKRTDPLANHPGTGRRLLLGVALVTLLAAAAGAGSGAPDRAWARDLPTVTIITNGWLDVRGLLRHVATNTGLGLQMAPDVQGEVNVHLEDVAADRALDAMLEPVGLGYEIVDGVLTVYKRGMVTRWITFDYPVTEREGRGELEISSSGGQTGGEGGGQGDSNQNKSHLTSTASMSIWPDVMKSLQVLVFRGTSPSGGDDEALAVHLSDSDGRSLVVNPMASLVQVTAEWDRVRQVERLLERLQEALQRQVAVEVRIMEVYLTEDTQTGIDWGTLLDGDVQAGLTTTNTTGPIVDEFFQFVVDGTRVGGVLEAISASGDLRTVSTPRITTLNNQKAVVRIVTEDIFYEAQVEPAIITNGVGTEPVVNYTPRKVPVGVVLDVTPQVGRDRVITLNVHPTISNVVGVAESPNADQAPILSVRELDTVGKVKDGQTLIIAGLITQRTRLTRTGIPLLKDIPVLGLLFGKTRDETYNIELVMLLTPTIMEGDRADELADAELEQMRKKF